MTPFQRPSQRDGAQPDGRHRVHRARVRAYVCSVAVIASLLAAVTATTVRDRHEFGLGYLVLFVGLIALGECLQLRYFHHEGVDALTLVEGMFAPLIFAGSGLDTVVAVAGGLGLASIARRSGVLKSTFNVAQWVASASVGALAFHASGASLAATSSNVLALVGALLAVGIVNQLLISGVLWCAAGHPLGSTEPGMVRMVAIGRGGSFAASTILGLLMTAAYQWVPWTVVLAIAPLVFGWSAGRAEASLRTDRRLLDGLQRATHHLAISLEPALALPPSLAEARASFEVREIQLVLVPERGVPVIHRCTGGADSYRIETGGHPLAEILVASLTAPIRLAATSGEAAAALQRCGYQRGVAAPLRANGSTFGVLLLLDREGVEVFEDGELAIAGALARELVGFLARVELVGAIKEERRKLNDIVQYTGDGIVSLDSEGTIRSWNTAMEAITGYRAADMVDSGHFNRLRPRDAQDESIQLATWTEQHAAGSLPAEMQIITADGQTVWLSCSYSEVPPADGRLESLIIVARNITQARELELLKDDFVAVVSHELRTPLVPIKGWAQTLLNRGERLTDDQRRTAVQSILTQAQRLEALVLNILESARVEAGQAEAVDTVDVTAIVSRVVDDVLVARPDRVIRVSPRQRPMQVCGSAVWVERALANLVANAVKYSPDESPVDVVVAAEGGVVSVSVTDLGPGISRDAQERIFERFERLEESRKQTGTGLGLYITRRLARAMGGDVALSSVPGAGSTFVLTLPSAAHSTAGSGYPAVDASYLPRPREELRPDLAQLG
jgi:PAS domain S-box-containing protein